MSMAPAQQKPETFMLSNEAQRSLPLEVQQALEQVDNLKYFLISAPVDWDPNCVIRRFMLPTGDYIACVLWNNLFHISGTDIVRCLSFRFHAFGRPVKNTKKFEEGIFSDLRNLKAGTDASLEEPKSQFLDFLYKNNCIRTQKKQKVFYWYSVPHDRLFLDALERDLKREKMGQEPTTIAISEPALSFEFDASQSLFEQLTKAQQANSSSLAANVSVGYGHTASPMVRPTDAMPPPQMAPSMQIHPEDTVTTMYGPVGMGQPVMNPGMVKVEQDYAHMPYDRPPMPLRMAPRHTSVPAYMEYSPAPSIVSSHYDEYASRGLSYEPVTPPQNGLPVGSDPAYIANEDTGLFTAIPDVTAAQAFNPMSTLPPSNFAGPSFPTAPPSRSYMPPSVYPVVEGSMAYKQRRRRSSLTPGLAHHHIGRATSNPISTSAGTLPPSVRYNDYARSTSAAPTVIPENDTFQDSPQTVRDAATGTYNPMVPAAVSAQTRNIMQEFSRHNTPLSAFDESAADREGSLALVGGAVDEQQHALSGGAPVLAQNAAQLMHDSPLDTLAEVQYAKLEARQPWMLGLTVNQSLILVRFRPAAAFSSVLSILSVMSERTHRNDPTSVLIATARSHALTTLHNTGVPMRAIRLSLRWLARRLRSTIARTIPLKTLVAMQTLTVTSTRKTNGAQPQRLEVHPTMAMS
ncbi:homeodomain transcription factor ste12 [Ascosphaera atra]|nr:homeodomain transcription factor ste12 [Ascosphaera atra]